jgi:hypothetical protein
MSKWKQKLLECPTQAVGWCEQAAHAAHSLATARHHGRLVTEFSCHSMAILTTSGGIGLELILNIFSTMSVKETSMQNLQQYSIIFCSLGEGR